MRYLSLFLLVLTQHVSAATWYVNPAASGTRDGTSPDHAWTSLSTIAWSSLSPGDTVRVADGSYSERLIIQKSGTSPDHRISFVGDTGRPKILGVTAGGHDYIAILNFEITHGESGHNAAGIVLNNADGWLIQDNYIHSLDGGGVQCVFNTVNNYNVVRGNRFDNLGIVPGSTTLRTGVVIFGHNNLIEYNFFAKGDDRTRLHGSKNIVRNNYFGPMQASDLVGTDPHIDDLQSFPSSLQFDTNLFESNFSENNSTANAHWVIIRDNQNANLRGLIARHNISVRNGSVIAILDGFADAWVYNNTFVEAQSAYTAHTKNRYCVVLTGKSPNHHWINNSFSRSSKDDGLDAILVGPLAATSFESVRNHTYLTGILSLGLDHLVAQSAQFVDELALDFRPSVDSPLRNAAAPLTTAVGSGSNRKELVVSDSGYFTDGWGVTQGDQIEIGNSPAVSVASVNYQNNTITLSAARTWSAGAPVRLAGVEGVGALSAGTPNAIAVTNTTAQSGAGQITLSAQVDYPQSVRYVQFIVDGIPVGEDYVAPYELNWSAPGGINRVEARAYIRHASKHLWASDIQNRGTSRPPEPPASLRVKSSE